MRREEKEQEQQLEKKIREMKIKRSKERREDPGVTQQPAGKKRKLNKFEYKRVLEDRKEAKRRERKEREQEPTVTRNYPIFEGGKRKS